MMRKRGRENPCFICGHYHKFEEGEVCGICGHKKIEAGEGEGPLVGAHLSAFPTEIIPNFLYLGTYDNASRSELLKAQGISYILNAVATCPNLYRNSFTYFSMPESSTTIPYDDCFEFLEQARNGGARVLVHCMSGQSRSPSIVAAYFMRREGLSLNEAVNFVKEKRPTVNLSQAIMDQLIQYSSVLASRQANGQVASTVLQQQTQESQAQLQQSPGSLQFDMSLVGSQNQSPASGVPGHLTFLGPSSGGNQPQQQREMPPPGSVPPVFSFQPPMPPQGFVFGAGSHAPPQGSGQ